MPVWKKDCISINHRLEKSPRIFCRCFEKVMSAAQIRGKTQGFDPSKSVGRTKTWSKPCVFPMYWKICYNLECPRRQLAQWLGNDIVCDATQLANRSSIYIYISERQTRTLDCGVETHTHIYIHISDLILFPQPHWKLECLHLDGAQMQLRMPAMSGILSLIENAQKHHTPRRKITGILSFHAKFWKMQAFQVSVEEYNIHAYERDVKFNMTLFPTLREIYLNIVAQH